MRLVDVLLAFPTLVLLLVLASLFRADSTVGLVLLLGSATWMPVARLVRAEAASLARQGFMEAAVGLGASPLRRAAAHLAPNVAPLLLVAATLQVGEMMLAESGLSFLGLGVAAPTPSWGDMVRQGMPALEDAWWVAAFPGLALAASVIGVNLIGDGLRDALDPRLSRFSEWPPRPGTPPAATS
jgi:peptide/nickel transport system permease protein